MVEMHLRITAIVEHRLDQSSLVGIVIGIHQNVIGITLNRIHKGLCFGTVVPYHANSNKSGHFLGGYLVGEHIVAASIRRPQFHRLALDHHLRRWIVHNFVRQCEMEVHIHLFA